MKTIHSIRQILHTSTGLINHLVTREMVYARTVEIASCSGRNSLQIKQLDYEQAKRELTGESDFDKQQAFLDAAECC